MSTVMMVGLPVLISGFPPLVLTRLVWDDVCGSLADLAGPPHRRPRGFLRGSSADLSGPSRRGPRGVTPRGCLFSHWSCWYRRGPLMPATGGPLLGSMRDLGSSGRAIGMRELATPLPESGCRTTAGATSVGRAYHGVFLVASCATHFACPHRPGAVQLLRRLRGSHFRVPWPVFLGRGILGMGTWNCFQL